MAVSPGPDQRQTHVAESLFRPEAGDHLPLRIEPDAVLLEILGGRFAPQAEDALGGRIAVVLRVAGGLGQFLDHHVLRRVAGVAHAQVDHVGAGPTLLVHQLIDFGEQVRRQPANPLGHLDGKRPVLGDRFVFGRDFAQRRSGIEMETDSWLRHRRRGCISRRNRPATIEWLRRETRPFFPARPVCAADPCGMDSTSRNLTNALMT